jgi:membrane-bound lytic murein transglycosylase D
MKSRSLRTFSALIVLPAAFALIPACASSPRPKSASSTRKPPGNGDNPLTVADVTGAPRAAVGELVIDDATLDGTTAETETAARDGEEADPGQPREELPSQPSPPRDTTEAAELPSADSVRDEILQADKGMEYVPHSKVPLEINERVRQWIHYFAKRDRERFQRFLSRGERFRPMIEARLREQGIPVELYYLAMIESGFVVRATSSAKAKGIWQFMPGTGRNYGLEVSHLVDERHDPIRATRSATRYLKDLHNIFSSWYLAIASYNAGEYRIVGAIKRGRSRDFWDLAERGVLPRETMDYIPKFMAAVIIGKNPGKYGFHREMDAEGAWPAVRELRVPSRARLSAVAAVAGIPLSELQAVNPQLSRGLAPKHGGVWIPAGRVSRFEDESVRAAIVRLRPGAPERALAASDDARTYRVRRGDNLRDIAQRHGVSVTRLRQLNSLRSNEIRVGQRLVISDRASNSRAAPARDSSRGQAYRVRRGDTLYSISTRFGVSVDEIKRTNRLRRNAVRVGQRLRIPPGREES